MAKRIWRGAALAPMAAVLAWGSAWAAQTSTRVHSFPYQAGDTVVVQNDYGRVRVQSAATSTVRAEVQRIAPDEAGLQNIAVAAQKSRDKIFVNVFFYEYRAEAAYIDVTVPESASVVVTGANPAVEVTGLGGPVRVLTQTGLITASDLTSSVSLNTAEGDILLRLRQQPEGDIRVETVRGDVRCELRPGLNLRGWVRAGRDLSWNREVEMAGGQLEKQIGVGGPLMLAASLQGSVTVNLNLSASVSLPSLPAPERTGRPEPYPTAGSREGDRYPGSGSTTSPEERYPETNDPRPAPTTAGEPAETVEDYRTNPDGTIDSGYSLKVNVNWTYLNISVRDGYTGRSIPDLRREDFLVYEDGAQQRIEKFESNEAPFSLLLLLDVSGSTKNFINLIQQASIEFTRQIKPTDSIAVAVFNSDVRLIQPFSNDRGRVERSIQRIRSGGGTAFYDALDTSIRDYMSGVEGRKAIVVFTDGVDNQLTGDWSNGSRTTFRELYRSIQEIDTLIYTIFLDTEERRRGSIIDILGGVGRGAGGDPEAYDEARRQLQQIAEQTGGRMYSPTDIYDLKNVYAEIADDLRIQYTLGYNSSNPNNDGRWHAIEVKIRNAPYLTVRTRKGYYSGGGP